MKALIAVDGSEGSFEAVSQIGPLVRPGKDALALFSTPPAGRSVPEERKEVLSRARHAVVAAIFDEAIKRLPEAQRAMVETIEGTRDARTEIVAAADKFGAQLLGLGARGLTRIQRLLLGSVSRAVVHTAAIPVWVARQREGRTPGQAFNILVACEGAEGAEKLAAVIADLSWPEGSTCRTLTVLPSMFAGKVPDWVQKQSRSPEIQEMVAAWAEEHQSELLAMRTQMEQFSAKLPRDCQCLPPIVAEGEPSEVVLSTIQREKIDLVVVGEHRKNWLTSTLLGSTSEAVLDHAACSVLAVPV